MAMPCQGRTLATSSPWSHHRQKRQRHYRIVYGMTIQLNKNPLFHYL